MSAAQPIPSIHFPETVKGSPSSQGSHLVPPRSRTRSSEQNNLSDSVASFTPSVVAPTVSVAGRNLVICLDGTLNTVGKSPTNVLQLFSLSAEDPQFQIRHYQASPLSTGIGVETKSWKPSHPGVWVKTTFDSAFGYRLGFHIIEAYHWLPGDRIFLFGFSRGAYTARCLAGMIEQVGILPPGNEISISLAYDIYKHSGSNKLLYPNGPTLAGHFKKHFTRDVSFFFLGVWDTVSSVGAIIPRDLPFASSSAGILHFRHALALDERRCLYAYHPHHSDPRQSDRSPAELKSIEELWFVGAHSDVGGGSSPGCAYAKAALSNISLKWMLREAVEKGLRLGPAFDHDPRFRPFYVEAQLGLEDRDSPIYAFVNDRLDNPARNVAFSLAVLYLATDQSTAAARADALAARTDALSLATERPGPEKVHAGRRQQDGAKGSVARVLGTLGWKLVEVLPIAKRRWSARESKFKLYFSPGLSRPRRLPENATFQPSVEIRKSATRSEIAANATSKSVPEPRTGYQPRAQEKGVSKWG
ncbi:hypothetical protein JCM10212_002117 [Sporobolomyces blumeae]